MALTISEYILIINQLKLGRSTKKLIHIVAKATLMNWNKITSVRYLTEDPICQVYTKGGV